MRFRHVTLATADPATLRPFYAEMLGLPVSDTTDGFVVAIGSSAMEFRRATADTEPTYHVAFSVPGGSIGTAAEWLAARTDLRTDDGRTRFRYESLGATAVYAADPAGNVLELLARDERAGFDDEFGPDSLLDIAEIGVVVDDVPAVAGALASMFDLDGPSEAEFAYLGDDGAFVLATPGRHWIPTEQPAVPAPLTVVATGGEGAVSFDDGRVAVVGIGD
jgi:catechol 2,3-dioxygenase-like lactoylglutathione lyase family enzyme